MSSSLALPKCPVFSKYIGIMAQCVNLISRVRAVEEKSTTNERVSSSTTTNEKATSLRWQPMRVKSMLITDEVFGF